MAGSGEDRYFRELAEHSNAVLWMFTADWDEVLFVNSAYEDIYGRSIDRLRDDPSDFLRAVHPDDRESVERCMETLSGGDPIDHEYRVNEAEDYGRRVWVEAEPIREDGEVVRVAGIARDLTDRREREHELERYATVIQATGDPVYTLDADGHFTFVNESLSELAGIPPDELIGQHASRVLSESDVERGAELIQELLSGDADRGTYEMDLHAADGRVIPCENHVALLPFEDDFRGTVGVLRDISERRERERELERQVDRFEAIFETIPEPLVHVRFDADGEALVERVNPEFTEVFGYTTEEIRGRSINEAIVPPDHLEEARSIDEQAQVGDTVEVELKRMAADGIRDFRFRVNWFDIRGGQREAIGVYVDLSEQKRRERELERQNQRLDEFASVVSHDLRNPMNVIQGRAELARETGDRRHFDAIDRATARMETLIEDLLSLARAGETVEQLEAVDLGTIVDGCWRTVETGAATVRTDAGKAVLADESRLQQLLENLFRNAVEHGGDDVTVTVGTTEDGFFVEDDGPGIPPAKRDQVFERGYTTAETGTGLGLRIVRSIAEAHGWDVSVTEGAAGGARFEVTGVAFA